MACRSSALVFTAVIGIGCTRAASPPPGPASPPPAAPVATIVAVAPESSVEEPIDDRVPAPTEPVVAEPELGCAAERARALPVRSAGGLVVSSPPAKQQREFKGRLRGDIEGTLSSGERRVWIGPPVPSFVPLANGTLELFVLDPTPSGYFALYRDPYDASSCKLSGSTNCAYEIAAFDCGGSTLFRVPLNKFLSRKNQLEVQDARMADRVVYFNEACQSYSREAGGRCSSLVALDPFSRAVLWRTRPLVSNNRFLVYPQYIVTGYGFTAEPDFLFIVRRSDGKVMHKESLPRAHEDLWDWQGALIVQLDPSSALAYRRDGFDGASPSLSRLVPLERVREP
jgi:hypothetical protein